MTSTHDWPRTDREVVGFVRSLGLDGLIDIHVHSLPPRLQEAVWAFFDRLDDPPWPIIYRDDEVTRLATLRDLGVIAHTTLAYGHKPGVAAWCNEHTLALAETHPQVIPTFTFHAEPEAADYVTAAIARGGRVAKVHLQVGRFHATDPQLDDVWPQLAAAGIPAVVHASGVYGVDGGHEYCGPDGIRALLERHPDLTIVIAHLGEPDSEGSSRWLKRPRTCGSTPRWCSPIRPTSPPTRHTCCRASPRSTTGCCSAATSPRSRTPSSRRCGAWHSSTWIPTGSGRSCTTTRRGSSAGGDR